MTPAIHFRGSASFLSNWYPCRVAAYGRGFRSVEHAYHFRKAMFHDDTQTAECIKWAWSGYCAKRRSSRIEKKRTNAEWYAVRVACMKSLLVSKFGGSKKLKDALLATGEAELVEWVPSHDGFWGIGIGGREGQNMLGKLVMEVREELRRNE